MRLAEGFVDINPRMEKLSAGLKQAESQTKSAIGKMQQTVGKYSAQIKKVGFAVAGMGAAITGTFTALVLKTAQLGDSFDKMSLRTGESVENLSRLGFAAKISGSDINALETSYRFLSRRMDEASQGIGVAKDAFDKLNISVTDSTGKLRPQLDMIKEVASKINGLTSESEKVAVAMDIFGARSGPALLPLLKQGEQGIEALMNRAEELGVVMSTDAAKASAEFTDRMTEMKESLKFAAIELGTNLLPLIKPLVESVTEAIGKITNWVKENKALTQSVLKFGLVLGPMLAAGGTLMVLAPTIVKITTAVKGLNLALIPLSKVVLPIAAALVTIMAARRAFKELFPKESEIGRLPTAQEIEEYDKAIKKALAGKPIDSGPIFDLGPLTAEEKAALQKYAVDVHRELELAKVKPEILGFLIPSDEQLNRVKTIARAYNEIFAKQELGTARDRDPYNLEAMLEANREYLEGISQAPADLGVPAETYQGTWLDAFQAQVQASREATDIVRKHMHLIAEEALELNNALRERDAKNQENMRQEWGKTTRAFIKTLGLMDKEDEEFNEARLKAWKDATEEKLRTFKRNLDEMRYLTEDFLYDVFFEDWRTAWDNFTEYMKRKFTRTLADMMADAVYKQFVSEVVSGGGAGGGGGGFWEGLGRGAGTAAGAGAGAGAGGGGTAGGATAAGGGAGAGGGGAATVAGYSTYGIGTAASIFAAGYGTYKAGRGIGESDWAEEHPTLSKIAVARLGPLGWGGYWLGGKMREHEIAKYGETWEQYETRVGEKKREKESWQAFERRMGVRRKQGQTASDYYDWRGRFRGSMRERYTPNLMGMPQESYDEYFRWQRRQQPGRGQRQPVSFQHGGIAWQPTVAMIGEAGPEAVVPLNKPSGLGGLTIQSLTVNAVFPNASLENMSQADFDRVMNTKIVPGIRNAAKNGLLNEVII